MTKKIIYDLEGQYLKLADALDALLDDDTASVGVKYKFVKQFNRCVTRFKAETDIELKKLGVHIMATVLFSIALGVSKYLISLSEEFHDDDVDTEKLKKEVSKLQGLKRPHKSSDLQEDVLAATYDLINIARDYF